MAAVCIPACILADCQNAPIDASVLFTNASTITSDEQQQKKLQKRPCATLARLSKSLSLLFTCHSTPDIGSMRLSQLASGIAYCANDQTLGYPQEYFVSM